MRSVTARAIALVSGTRPLLLLVTVATVALCVVLAVAVPVARAQEVVAPAETAAPAAEAIPAPVAPAAVPAPTEEAPPPEVTADTTVTAQDLGVKESRVLPGNPFYAFKRFGWGVQKAFTFNPVKKATLDLHHANQELADATKRAETTGANDAVVRALERAQGRLQAISAQVGALQDAKATNAAGVDALLERAAAGALQQQSAMEHMEEGASPELRERIAVHRDGVLAEVGAIMGAMDDPDAMRQRLERAMTQQRGSEFKDFKNIGVLQQLEGKVPEEARAAIRAAQERAVERVAARVAEQPGQAAKFAQYVQHLPGDQVRQFATLDDVRAKLPSEFVESIDRMKTRAVEKFNTEFAQRGVEGRARMLEAFRDGDVEAVGLAEQFKNFVPPEARVEIEKHENASIEQFKQQFAGQQTATGEDAGVVADEAKRLMEKVRTNPEPTDFIVLQKLKGKLTPEQQAFVQGLERDGARRFEEQFRARGAEFLERFSDPNAPQSLEVLEELRGSVPGTEGIDRAIEVHRQRFQEHLRDLEDPAILKNINDAIEGNADLKAGFEKGDPSFFLQMEERRGDMERQARERMEREVRARFEEPGGGGIPLDVESMTPEVRERFEQILEERGVPAPPPGGGGAEFPMPGAGFGRPQGVPFEGGTFAPPGVGGGERDVQRIMEERRAEMDAQIRTRVLRGDAEGSDRGDGAPREDSGSPADGGAPAAAVQPHVGAPPQPVGMENPAARIRVREEERMRADVAPVPSGRRDDGQPSGGGGGAGGFGPLPGGFQPMPGGFQPGGFGSGGGGASAPPTPQPSPSFNEPLGILAPFRVMVAWLP